MRIQSIFTPLERKNPHLATMLRAQIQRSLRPVAIGLTALYSILALSHWLFLTGTVRIVMGSIAFATAIFYALFLYFVDINKISSKWMHPISGLFVVPALINTYVHIYLQNDILQTTNIAFALIAIGGFLLSFWLFVGFMIAIIGSWILIMILLPESPYTFHFIFALIISSMLGLIFFQSRMRMFAALSESDQREKLSQQQLQASMLEAQHNAERFQALAQATTEGVVMYNQQGIIDANSAFIEMIGLPYEEIIGTIMGSFVHPDDVDRASQHILTTPDLSYELRFVRADGGVIFVRAHGRQVIYEGEPTRIVSLLDISRQKEIETNLLRAKESAEEANQAKGFFLSTLSHELRTPLNAVLGFTEVITDELNDQGITFVNPELGKIRYAGHKLLAMINNVLELVEIEAESHHIHLNYIDIKIFLVPLIERMLYLAKKNDVTIHYTPPDTWGLMVTDEELVTKILYNVLDNAVKFTSHGTINIDVQHQESPDGEMVNFIIKDTGIGIAERHLTRLFEPFFQVDSSSTRKYEGVGMGLTLSQRLCTLLGGSMQIESVPDQGTICTVTLPATSNE